MANRFSKKHYVIGSFLIYVILIVIHVLVEKRKLSYEFDPCFWYPRCVRFCCDDGTKCNEKYIREHFNSSLIPAKDGFTDTNKTEEVEVLFANPKCKLNKIPSSTNWTFAMHGQVVYKNEYEYVNHYDYCIKPRDSDRSDDETVLWDLFVCRHGYSIIWRVLFYLLYITPILLLSAPVFIFVYFAELRTVNGKCVTFFTSSVLISYIGILVMHSEDVFSVREEMGLILVAFGLMFSFLWMTTLTFDVWWNFRKFQPTSNDKIRFKCYCKFVLGLSSVVIVPLIVELLVNNILDHNAQKVMKGIRQNIFFSFIFVLVATLLVDICFIVLTAYKIFKMSLTLNSSSNVTRFKYEKERFWTVIELYGIMLICWPIQIITWIPMEKLSGKEVATIVSDIISLFSVLLITAILLLQDDVKRLVFSRYNIIT